MYIQAQKNEVFLIIDLNTINEKDRFPISLLISDLKQVGIYSTEYITDCKVIFAVEKERAEAIHTILTQKKIKSELKTRIKEEKIRR